MSKETDFILDKKVYLLQFHAVGTLKARGVSLLFKNTCRFQLQGKVQDERGRYLFVKGTLNEAVLTFVAVYAPNEGQVKFFQDVFQKLMAFREGTVFIAGDFNYIMNLSVDRTYQCNRDLWSSKSIYTKIV